MLSPALIERMVSEEDLTYLLDLVLDRKFPRLRELSIYSLQNRLDWIKLSGLCEQYAALLSSIGIRVVPRISRLNKYVSGPEWDEIFGDHNKVKAFMSRRKRWMSDWCRDSNYDSDGNYTGVRAN
jgi:hypothetical protein